MLQDMQPSRVIVGVDSQSRGLGIADALTLHGYDVRSAYDGDAVLELADSWSADSAVIELSIPGMPAFEVAREIRKRVGRKVRLVGMTTFTDTHYRNEAVSAGFDDVILGRVEPGEILLSLGGAGAELVMRHRSVLYEQARQMIALGHRLLNGRRFCFDEAAQKRRVMLARRAMEWSKASLDVTPVGGDNRDEAERDLRALAGRIAYLESEAATPAPGSKG